MATKTEVGLGIGFVGMTLAAGYLVVQNALHTQGAVDAAATATPPTLGSDLLTPGPGSEIPGSEILGSSNWPKTPEEIAALCGGDASQWQRNSEEWPDSRTIANPALGITGYINREWRPTNPENLPFSWPKTAEEAVNYFFPSQDPEHPIDPKFMQPAWIDPSTGQVMGWHLSEDHWLDGGPADVTLLLHPCEVAEGYTVNGTLDPVDDRNWVAYGGANNNGNGGVAMNLAKGQGMTMWMPGTDPNAIALRMELFVGADTPHYRGQKGEQLGPDAINFIPVYNAPKQNILSDISSYSYRTLVAQTFVESPREILKKSMPLAGGTNPSRITRPQDLGKRAMAYKRNPFKGQVRF